MIYGLFIFLLFVAILLEGTITSFPFVLVLLICLYIIFDEEWVFLVALLSGFILDSMTVRVIGQSSLFFIAVLFIISLYENKYETKTVPFFVVATFLGSLFYLIYIGSGFVLLQAFIISIIVGIIVQLVIGKR